MPTVSVIYPRREGARFDFEYYAGTHLPLVANRWADSGLTGVEALKGVSAPGGGETPFVAIALISFGSMESFQAAMGGPHAGEIMADVANFTDIQPIIQVNVPID